MGTYLLRPGETPLYISDGVLLDCSGTGKLVVLKDELGDAATPAKLLTVDPATGSLGETELLGKVFDARLTRDGRELFVINDENRLFKRTLADGEDVYLTGGDDRKSHLSVSADGNALAFVSALGEDRHVIYGRYSDEGEMRLVSLTEQTGFTSDYFALSADGHYLLAYGSRTELLALVSEARGTLAEDEQPEESTAESEDSAAVEEEAGEAVEAGTGVDPEQQVDDEELMPRPPRRRERFGVIRFDLSGSPHAWTILSVDPRFIAECEAQFSNAGPF
jgi:hypothetical protein